MMPLLYYLCLERIKDSTRHRCKMLATSVDEALRTAQASYGPVRLLASGTRDPGIGCQCMGSGQFLPTRYDKILEPDLKETLQLQRECSSQI